ncbi:MAG: ubiquinol-cytochrome C chaperone family protein [Rhodospirillales bacterium]|nr:ubiquinol-cytochrome C chaperone family protein [Rhodospirillales bacterium]
MAVGRIWRHLKGRRRRREAARRLYTAAVRQARVPILYTEGGVADTLDGRFDLIVLHVVPLMRRLRQCGEPGRQMSQALFDVMFDDMDQSLREMGVGDLRVGKRVKQMARAFYGRAKAYDDAFDQAPGTERRSAIAEALERNVYNNAPPPDARLQAMAHYVETILDALDGQSAEALLGGAVELPPAPPLATAAEGGQ